MGRDSDRIGFFRRFGGELVPVAVILAVAVLFGGGGRGAALANLLVQLIALGVLAANRHLVIRGWWRTSRFLKILLVATLALPLLQLIPLPPALWQALPGRDLVTSSLALVGADNSWRPMSTVPSVTLLAATGLIAPFILFFAAMGVGPERHDRIQLMVVGLALVVILVGALQLSSGGSIGAFYHSREPDYLLGTFANHNSTGLYLLLALCFLIEFSAGRRLSRAGKLGAISIGLLLLLSIVLTMSRSSIVLLLAPLGLLLFKLRNQANLIRRRSVFAIAIALSLASLGLVVAAVSNDRVESALQRFTEIEDARLKLWQDSFASAQRFMPFGSGMGTFDDVIQIDESLETIQVQRAGRAHNDYLEILVEGGAFSISLLFIWLAYIAARIFGKRTAGAVSKPFIVSIVLLYALQSVLDYPLRSQALLCLAAVALALIESGRKRIPKGSENVS